MGRKRKKYPNVKKINQEELQDLLSRARQNSLTEDDCNHIEDMANTIGYIIDLLHQKNVRIKQMLKDILGIKSEKTKNVKDRIKGSDPESDSSQPEADAATPPEEPLPPEEPSSPDPYSPDEQPAKAKGHGRIGADEYTGATQIYIPHESLQAGDSCVYCPKGKLYECPPKVFVHIEGKPPLPAKVYKGQKLRCNLCGAIFVAKFPEELEVPSSNGSKYYDETAKSMIVILKYGYGFPLNRISQLQSDLGIPLPVATAWEKSEEVADRVYKAYSELIRFAAQGEIFHNDDTGMKVLALLKEIEAEKEAASNAKDVRTGIFTTGIVSIVSDKKIVLFFTGRNHAGENLKELMNHRESLPPPIQMCDAKNGNTPSDVEAIVCNCNVHARRYFVKAADNYPDECLHVITDIFGRIYKHDAEAKEQQLSPEERLSYHQEKSGPIMKEFHEWLNRQFNDKLVEPNSELGQAINYVLNHYKELTKFLHVPGVPLDNNICERALKKAILHRKNSLFYKNEHGAYIGDMFMSMIYTCNLNGIDAFDYLTQLQIHSSEVFKNPSEWLPWNYQATISKSSLDESIESVGDLSPLRPDLTFGGVAVPNQ